MSFKILIRIATMAAMLAGSYASNASALTMPNLWVARFSTYQSQQGCAYGASDCNRCVYNVEEQFRNLTQRDAHFEKVKNWSFGNGIPGEINAIPTHHFQSFIRAPNDTYASQPNLFASYSNGVIFGSTAATNANASIKNGNFTYKYGSAGNHPGGMQALGRNILIATEETSDDQARLEIISTDAPAAPPRVAMLPDMARVANVSATKLAGGGYMLLLSNSSFHTKYSLFYTPSLTDLRLERMLPTAYADWDTGFHDGSEEQNGFENLSMINECGTGKTYAIGTTAPTVFTDGTIGTYPKGKSVWALYELRSGTDVVMKHITNNTKSMFSVDCDPRASGTAFAGRSGQLGLYCHQKFANGDFRRDVVGCALGFFFQSLSFTLGFCGSIPNPDKYIYFTEFWPHETYEAPAEALVDVNITINPLSYVNLGVIEETTGSVCQSDYAVQTCKWRIPKGQTVTLTPFRRNGMSPNVSWVESIPQSAGTSVCRTSYADGMVAPCQLTVDAPISVGLYDYEVL